MGQIIKRIYGLYSSTQHKIYILDVHITDTSSSNDDDNNYFINNNGWHGQEAKCIIKYICQRVTTYNYCILNQRSINECQSGKYLNGKLFNSILPASEVNLTIYVMYGTYWYIVQRRISNLRNGLCMFRFVCKYSFWYKEIRSLEKDRNFFKNSSTLENHMSFVYSCRFEDISFFSLTRNTNVKLVSFLSLASEKSFLTKYFVK